MPDPQGPRSGLFPTLPSTQTNTRTNKSDMKKSRFHPFILIRKRGCFNEAAKKFFAAFCGLQQLAHSERYLPAMQQFTRASRQYENDRGGKKSDTEGTLLL